MRILGLVVEYNPFHLGHLHHLTKSKEVVAPDATVAVMSGNFTQRGEPAIVDKWARARMALNAGVDLVLELPTLYAVRSAPHFAQGAMQLLASIGVTDICFGSETGQLALLEEVAEVLANEPAEYRTALKAALSTGASYARAQGVALQTVLGGDAESVYQQPNNTLAVQYIKAIKQYKLPISANTIRRTNSFNSLETDQQVISARAIRNAIFENQGVVGVPQYSRDVLMQCFEEGQGPVFWPELTLPLIYRLRLLGKEGISSYPDTGEGLADKLSKAARLTNSWPELMLDLKTKRYPFTRIQRLLCHILLGLDEQALHKSLASAGPRYVRALAMNDQNKAVRQILKQSQLPVIISPARSISSLTEAAISSLQLDIRASDIFTLAWKKASLAGLDFYRQLIKP